MSEGIGPQKGSSLKKKGDTTLDDLRVVPAPDMSNAVPAPATPVTSQPANIDENLGDTSFDFGLQTKYERIRTEHRKELIGTARERRSEIRHTDQSRSFVQHQDTSEATNNNEFYAEKDSDTVLDKLVNWFASQLKKLETLVLSSFGVKSIEALKEEEELEELQRQGQPVLHKKLSEDDDEEDGTEIIFHSDRNS